MGHYFYVSYWGQLLGTGPPFYVVIRATRRSTRLQGKGSTFISQLCIGQIEASTCPPPGIPRAFDTSAVPGRREFDYQSPLWGGEFDPHALGVGNLNSTLDFM